MKYLMQIFAKIGIIFAIILLSNTLSCKQSVPEGLTDEEANAVLEKTLKGILTV